MEDLKALIQDLRSYTLEEEWFEFKENWYEPSGIGEYISSMSNVAAMIGKEYAYLVWGINNETHELTGTTFDYHRDVKNEPLEHFLARQIFPDINFQFHELTVEEKRVVILSIPAAEKVPTAFNNNRFLRIGSSKVNLNKFPERESKLFDILRNDFPTMESMESYSQELTFRKLFLYYEDKGIVLNKDTFKKNLGLLTKDGKYNLLAQLLSDDSKIPIRVSIFSGTDKTSPLYSVREFGNSCVLISLDKILEYGDVLNIIQANEQNRIVERKEVPLFNPNAFREAIINAFVHNLWISGNAPMITIYSDRIEILSRGTLAPTQTIEGFYLGESVPVNRCLSDIFLQLHISERSGRGVPIITKEYGKNAYEFREKSIVVTIPFERLANKVGDNVADKVRDKSLNATRTRILEEMRNNPNITQPQLSTIIGIGRTATQNNISYLRRNGFIERVGSNKNGYWKVLQN
ncbi:RNA-binding domain-containing protein [Clostridium sp. AN503]|uniref:RNA-binding domain-containing protein n=1 Tax=Clostridium sp. AN503 TaxID=3160598 RepID=UPI003457942C